MYYSFTFIFLLSIFVLIQSQIAQYDVSISSSMPLGSSGQVTVAFTSSLNNVSVSENNVNVGTNCAIPVTVDDSSSSSNPSISSSLSSSLLSSSQASSSLSSSPNVLSSSILSSSSLSVSSSISPSSSLSVSSSISPSSSLSVSSSISPSSSLSSSSYNSNFTSPIYIPPNWNQRFLQQLNKSSTQLTKIGVLGDSISAGSYASNQLPNSQGRGWVNLLQTQLQTIYGDGGSGFVELSQTPQFANNYFYTYPTTIPCETVGSWMTNTGSSGSMATFYLNTYESGDYITCYTRGTSIHVYLFPSSLYTISIDGGPPINYTTLNPLGNLVTDQVITGLSNSNHTVTVTTTGPFTICGVAGFNNAGVVVNAFTIPGLQSSIMTVNSNGAVWNFTGGTALPSLQADLLIIALGANDEYVPSSSINTDMQTFLSGARTSWNNSQVSQSIMIIDQNYGNYVTADILAAIPVRLAAAQQYNCAYLDLYYLLGNNSWTYSISQGFWSLQGASGFGPAVPLGASGFTTITANYIHPSDSGHANITNYVLPYLLQNAYLPSHVSSSSSSGGVSISSSVFSSSVLQSSSAAGISSSVLQSSSPVSSLSSSSTPVYATLPPPSVWLVADSLNTTLTNGSSVTTWTDKANSIPFTPDGSPPIFFYPTNGNGHAAISFNGHSGLSSTLGWPVNGQSVTVAMVLAPGPPSGSYLIFLSNPGFVFYFSSQALGFLSVTFGGGYQSTYYVASGAYKPIIVMINYNLTQFSLYVNGVYYGSLATSLQSTSPIVNLATDYAQGPSFIGNIFEVMIYNQSLTNAQMNAWVVTAGLTYNISIVQPGPSTANVASYPFGVLPTPNIWMVADSLASSYQYGSNIPLWTDITSNQISFHATFNPNIAYSYAQYLPGNNTNGHGLLRFVENVCFSNPNAWNASALPATVYFVMSSAPTTGSVIYSTTSQYNVQISPQNNGTIEISTNAELTNYSGIPLNYTPITVMTELMPYNWIAITVNSAYSGTYSAPTTQGTSFLGLGCDYYGGGYFAGDFYEILVFYEQLSFSQKLVLFNYTNYKYNI